MKKIVLFLLFFVACAPTNVMSAENLHMSNSADFNNLEITSPDGVTLEPPYWYPKVNHLQYNYWDGVSNISGSQFSHVGRPNPSGLGPYTKGEFTFSVWQNGDEIGTKMDAPKITSASKGHTLSMTASHQRRYVARGTGEVTLTYPCQYSRELSTANNETFWGTTQSNLTVSPWQVVVSNGGYLGGSFVARNQKVLKDGDQIFDSTTLSVTDGQYIELSFVAYQNITVADAVDEGINAKPMAVAGADQLIVEIGSAVSLDGTDSYDTDGDIINYFWQIVEKPANSLATLSDVTSAQPSFVADIHGDYIFSLTTSDQTLSSDPDFVKIGFNNIKPVANAGFNQSVVIDNTVFLDGSLSSDENMDNLTYSWFLMSQPLGSYAVLDDEAIKVTSFYADIPGKYLISLVVSDGIEESAPAVITVIAISNQDASTNTLQDLINLANDLNEVAFGKAQRTNAFTNKVNSCLSMIQTGEYLLAKEQLENDLLGKTDGCVTAGGADPNDWVTDCAIQQTFYYLISDAISYLEPLTP